MRIGNFVGINGVVHRRFFHATWCGLVLERNGFVVLDNFPYDALAEEYDPCAECFAEIVSWVESLEES